jgi:hypothetical protein
LLAGFRAGTEAWAIDLSLAIGPLRGWFMRNGFFWSRACFDPQLQSWIMHLGITSKKKTDCFYCVQGVVHKSQLKNAGRMFLKILSRGNF